MEVLIIANFMDKDIESLSIMKENLNHSGVDYYLSMRFQGCKPETITKVKQELKPKYWQIGENIGNAQGLNLQLYCNQNLTENGLVILDPDIKKTKGWLKAAIQASEAIDNVGMIGWKWRPVKGRNATKNGIKINRTGNCFGSRYITKLGFEKVGYFLELSMYGQWDGQHKKRMKRAELDFFYLADYPSIHTPSNRDSEVRKFKDEQIEIANKELNSKKEYYNNLTYYNPFTNG